MRGKGGRIWYGRGERERLFCPFEEGGEDSSLLKCRGGMAREWSRALGYARARLYSMSTPRKRELKKQETSWQIWRRGVLLALAVYREQKMRNSSAECEDESW